MVIWPAGGGIQQMAKERTSVRMQTQIKIMSEQGHSIRTIATSILKFSVDCDALIASVQKQYPQGLVLKDVYKASEAKQFQTTEGPHTQKGDTLLFH
jgi:hypothetical protein